MKVESTINKNYKIYFPKARGEARDIIYPVYADTKYDGELNFFVKDEFINKDKYGRHRKNMPAIAELLKLNIPEGYVVAGELYYGNDVYDFLRNKDNDHLKFAAFDMWKYQETSPNVYQPIDRSNYRDRRAALEALFAAKVAKSFGYAHISKCSIVNDLQQLEAARQTAINSGYEGLIAKSGLSLWLNADLKSWTKLKKNATADLIIMGYSRKAKYLSLLLGHINSTTNKLTPLCGCGSGLTYDQKITYAAMLEKDKLPANQQTNNEYVLVHPKYLAEVAYQELTKLNGQISALRHPVFMRLRDDKTIKEVSAL